MTDWETKRTIASLAGSLLGSRLSRFQATTRLNQTWALSPASAQRGLVVGISSVADWTAAMSLPQTTVSGRSRALSVRSDQ